MYAFGKFVDLTKLDDFAYSVITWFSSWQGKTEMTEHLSVDQSVSLGGAAVTIILPSPDQTQPATEDRGLEKFIWPAAAGSFF